ncbi:MAG TPA: type 1 glutamine amidotransferase [Jatrophihabitantaceae bacterium]
MAVLVVQNDASDPIGPLGEWLVDAGVELDVRDRDALPERDGYDGLIVLGGGQSADDPTGAPVRALLARALADELPTLGICLGAQQLAVALGGVVGPNPEGPEYGAQLVAKRANASTDPLFRDLPITPDVIQWHRDAVLQLPASAVQLASSPGCDVQAFRAGRLAWGIQFHIETTPEVVRAWAASDAAALDGYDVERMLERSDAVHPDIAEVWQPFAAAFAGVVADPASVPARRPLRMTTAEPVTDPAAIRAALAAEAQAARQLPQ